MCLVVRDVTIPIGAGGFNTCVHEDDVAMGADGLFRGGMAFAKQHPWWVSVLMSDSHLL